MRQLARGPKRILGIRGKSGKVNRVTGDRFCTFESIMINYESWRIKQQDEDLSRVETKLKNYWGW